MYATGRAEQIERVQIVDQRIVAMDSMARAVPREEHPGGEQG